MSRIRQRFSSSLLTLGVLLLAPALLRANAQATVTSGIAGIQTTVLDGDPRQAGLYTIALSVPPNTRIEAHTHRDQRSATVISGIWQIGYGARFDERALHTLPPGSFYTEPSDVPHFAQTGAEAAVVYITGIGPSDTEYVSE